MRIPWMATAFVLMTALRAQADEGCSRDIDCKGERVCVQGQCVDPSRDVSPKASTAAPAAVQGAPPVNVDTRHRHLGGFIRPDLGFGYHSMSASSNGTDASIAGFAASFGIAAGGAVSENNILAFHLWDVVTTNPTVTIGSQSVSNANATLTVIAFGPEYTRYFSDNYYFVVTPSLTRATLSTSGNSADTNWGFGLRAGLGKEWWVGDHWGLGVVGHLSLNINQDSGSNAPTWTGLGGSLAFSATYN